MQSASDVGMPPNRHLHLDGVIASMPELGPMIPGGGYSRLLLLGIIAVQVIAPTILPIYGVVIGYLCVNTEPDINLGNGSVNLMPVLFAACCNLADPLTQAIIGSINKPRFMGFMGVILLSTGILASGYWSIGGSGVYLLANVVSASVMGLGASLTLSQSENLLGQHFRTRPVFALILKNVAFSVGLMIVPGWAYVLLSQSGLQTARLLLATVIIPALFGACTFHTPIVVESTQYRSLVSEADSELNIRDGSDVMASQSESRENDRYSFFEDAEVSDDSPPLLFGEGSNAYGFFEPEDDDMNVFTIPSGQRNLCWREKYSILKKFKFWIAVVTLLGIKSTVLSLVVFSVPVGFIEVVGLTTFEDAVVAFLVLGFGTLVPSVAFYWHPKTARWRSIYFGSTCWLGVAALAGFYFCSGNAVFLLSAFLGGVSMGGCAISQDSALRDLLGTTHASHARIPLSVIIGSALLPFVYIKRFSTFLEIAMVIQLIGGTYWIITPILGAIQAARIR